MMSTVDEAMNDAARAEMRSYRGLVEQCRHRASQEMAELRSRRLPAEEHRIRESMIWAKFTLSTADLELAILAISDRLAEFESLKSIRMAVPK